MSTTETTGRQGKCTAERPEVGTRTRRHACNALGWSDEPASTLRRGRYNFQRSGEGQRPSTTEHVQQCAETLLGVTGSSVPHSDRSTLNKLKDFKQVLRQRSPWLLLLECFFRKIAVGFRGRFFFPSFFVGGSSLLGLYWDDWELSFLLSWLEGALPFQGEWAPSAGELLKLSSSSSPFAPSNCVFSSRVIRRSSSSPNSPPIRVGSPTIITS